MSTSNTLANQLLTASLTGNTYSGPESLYVSLYSTAPTASSSGTELSGSGYSRQTVAFSIDTANSRAVNTAAVVFGPATADWATARAWAVVDNSSGGNILYFSNFAPTQTLKETYTFSIGSGNLIIDMT